MIMRFKCETSENYTIHLNLADFLIKTITNKYTIINRHEKNETRSEAEEGHISLSVLAPNSQINSSCSVFVYKQKLLRIRI